MNKTTAERLAEGQREISISEFFAKNKHLLGFDNKQKALLTAVKEAVDNALDACEEAKILPALNVFISELGPGRFKVSVQDNGPGIVHRQIGPIFGKLLYGSKFHRLKQSRGQQGIGISAAGLYAQLSTGSPVVVTSSTGGKTFCVHVRIDQRSNTPEILRNEVLPYYGSTGTMVSMEIDGVYRSGKRSVDEYIEQTAMANPHASIGYVGPTGEVRTYRRLVDILPAEPKETKPHPRGVELGVLLSMLKETPEKTAQAFLKNEFSRITDQVARSILGESGLPLSTKPSKISTVEAEKLHKALQTCKILNPFSSCVVPIGYALIEKSLENLKAEFKIAVTRRPEVYRGFPFQVEAAIAYGGKLPEDDFCQIYRLANRVPLQYQQSDCAITRAVMDTDWRAYGVRQSRGALPTGPVAILVHLASVWVPFTSESKEAVARYPEILREIKLALQMCGRKLAAYLRARKRSEEEEKKQDYIKTYIPHIGLALRSILGLTGEEEAEANKMLVDTLEKSRKFM